MRLLTRQGRRPAGRSAPLEYRDELCRGASDDELWKGRLLPQLGPDRAAKGRKKVVIMSGLSVLLAQFCCTADSQTFQRLRYRQHRWPMGWKNTIIFYLSYTEKCVNVQWSSYSKEKLIVLIWQPVIPHNSNWWLKNKSLKHEIKNINV